MTQQRHHRSDLRAIARQAMIDSGLLPDFPPEVLAQVEAIRGPASGSAPGLEDMRSLAWFSIDNDDSRDLDQLSASERLPDGRVRLMVAVADVDALVPDGTPADMHARANTTSIYTPAQIFPMLPERLSTDLTSLNPDQDRVATVVTLDVGKDGAVSGSSVRRAVVHSKAQLVYEDVGRWLEGNGPLPSRAASVPGMDARLREQDEAAQALRHRRHEEGSLDLESLETHAKFEGENIVDLSVQEHDRGRQLIEELMVAANGVVAEYLLAQGVPSLRRVVRSPERWLRIAEVAKELGDPLPAAPDGLALSQFLARRRKADPLRFPDLSLTIVKLMGRGEYVVERPGHPGVGHFGLAVREYTHSTAPNRRYPDLLTQRLVKAALSRARLPYDADQLDVLAAHCTEREDAATKVERHLRKSAAALLLEGRIGEKFDGIVTGASDKGTWVRTFRPPVEGRLSQGWRGLRVGGKVRVELISTDVDMGYIDFARA